MRYESQKDIENDCLTLIDNEDELKTSFDSEIILYPLEGAEQIVMTTRGLYLLFESSAKKYRNTARLSNDQIFVIRMTD